MKQVIHVIYLMNRRDVILKKIVLVKTRTKILINACSEEQNN